MERQQELKVLLKRWEAEFLRERHRKPSQVDIEEAPEETQRLYREYRELKRREKASGQTDTEGKTEKNPQEEQDLGFWGSHLNRTPRAPKAPGRSQGRSPRAGIAEIYGRRLKAKLGTSGKEPPLTPNPRRPPKPPQAPPAPAPAAEISSENPENSQNSEEFLEKTAPNPEFFPVPDKFLRLQRSVGRTLSSLDPAWIRRCEEFPEKNREFPEKNREFRENLGNLGRKRPREGDGAAEAPAKICRGSEGGIETLEGEKEEGKMEKKGKKEKKEKEKSQSGEMQEEEEEEKAKGTRRARAPARNGGNFVRLNLKRKTYTRGSLKGKFLRKQVWKQKWRKKFGGGADVCFRCGGKGHWAAECRGKDLGSFPKEIPEDEEKVLLTLEEVARRTNGDFIPEIPNGSTTENSQLPSTSLDFPQPEFSPPPPMDPLYPPNPDGTIPDPPEEVLEALRILGYDSFRPGQAEAIMRVLSGISTLLLLPTGSGKSLCYQLPAFLYHRRSRCISLVISPLVSLMDDQVSGLPSPLKAVCIHSNLTQSQRETAIKKVRSGQAQILLISPESVTGSEFFSRLFRHFPPVAFTCLDEAHCISQWSHNFRPAYLRVCKVLRERLGVRCFLGLTATATAATARDVAQHLGIPEGQSAIGGFGIPENLRLSVSVEADRDQAVLRLLRRWSLENFGNSEDFGNSVLVYCTRRQESERLAALIRAEFTEIPGKKARKGKGKEIEISAAYHAGLSPQERRRIQRSFMEGGVWALCATESLGLGLHKANLRGVLQRSRPGSLQGLLQHAGRAGRDGNRARCHVCISHEDEDFLELRRHIHENSVDFWAVKALIQRVFAPCKCLENQEKNQENSQEFSRCRGHERSVPVLELEQELDLRQEGIETLLCLLELHPGGFLELLPPLLSRCRLRLPRERPELLREAARGCPPLEFLLARGVPGNSGNSGILGILGISGSLEFDAVALSDALGWELHRLRESLGRAGRSSGIQVEFLEFSFHFRARGDLSPQELDLLVEFLNSRVRDREKAELRRLRSCCQTLHSVALVPEEAQDQRLRELLREHFLTELEEEEEEEEEENSGIPKELEEEVGAEIRKLLAAYPEQEFSGRAIARIFHGIGSPRFPAQVFGRDRRFWRRRLELEFRSLARLGSLEILRWR